MNSWNAWDGKREGQKMKSLIIAKSNLRKNITSSLTLVLLVVLAIILMYTGSNILLDMGKFLDQKNKEMNGADYFLVTSEGYSSRAAEILQEIPGFQKAEMRNSIVLPGAIYSNTTREDKERNLGFIFYNMEEQGDISKLQITGETGKMKENSIILPYYLKSADGYQVGDQLTIRAEGKTYQFEVYGFAEDILFATPSNITIYKCFITREKYEEMASEVSAQALTKSIYVALTKSADVSVFANSYAERSAKEKAVEGDVRIETDYQSMKVGTSATLLIFNALFLVFSIVILTISLVIIRFTLITHIEENIRSIGSMEAMGYSSRQLIQAILVEFLLIGGAGVVTGLVISVGIADPVSGFASSMMGIRWVPRFNGNSVLICFLVVTFMFTIGTLATAGRIRKITPIMALRSGIETHNLKKNHMPVEKTGGNLHVVIGLKNFFHNRRQNLSIGIITLLIAYAFTFIIAMYYNFVIEKTVFRNLVGMEIPDVTVIYGDEDYQDIFDDIAQLDGVRKVLRYTDDNVMLTFKDQSLASTVNICEDFSECETKTVYEGRYPEHDNEIAISSVVEQKLKAGVGDTISIKINNRETEYIVVGIMQHINQLGKSVALTEMGMKQADPEFMPGKLYVYADDHDANEELMDEIKDVNPDRQMIVKNSYESMEYMIGSFKKVIGLLCEFFVGLMCIILILIMYFLVKVKIIKEKVTIGIHKALGFTNRELMVHTIVSYLPVIFIGSGIGSIAGKLFSNRMCALMLGFAGIHRGNMEVPVSFSVITVAVVTLVSLVVTWLVSRRISKIHPMELLR